VAEGIDAIMFYVTNQNHWGSEKRMPVLLERLRSYGVHAKRTIPELEKLAAYFDGGEKGYPKHLSERKAKYVRETVEFLKKTEERPELIEIL
jgi:ABC-type taurine transport system substrate-binding protein